MTFTAQGTRAAVASSPTQVFLWYAGEDRPLAEPVFLALTGQGYDVFFDKDDLHAGADFLGRIKHAVNSCDLFVFIVTEHSVADGSFTLTELEYARRRWKHPKDHVVAVRADQVPFAKIPAYLTAVAMLEPVGNLSAAVVDAVAELKPPHPLASRMPSQARSRLASWLRPRVLVPLLVALVSAIGAIGAALIVKPTPPPNQWSATIDDCAVEPSPSSIDEYLSRMHTPEGAAKARHEYTAQRLRVVGRTVSYQVHFVGPPQERYPVHLRVFEATTHQRVRIEDDEETRPVVRLRSDTDDDRFRDVVWFEPMKVVTDPMRRLFVELEVRNRQNQPMAKCTTPEFCTSVTGGHVCVHDSSRWWSSAHSR